MKRFFCSGLSVSLMVYLLLVFKVHAQLDFDILTDTPTPTLLPPGQEYILEIEQIDPNSATSSAGLSVLSSSEKNIFNEQGYVIKSPEKNNDISFSVDRSQVAFTSFKVSPMQEKEVTLHINAGSSIGFQLLMETVAPFSSAAGTELEPTQCNSNNLCTPTRAQLWTDSEVPGWGYSLSGRQISQDFISKNWFRPVSLEHPVTLIHAGQLNNKSSIKLNWKVVAPNISEETYSTIIKLVTIPY